MQLQLNLLELLIEEVEEQKVAEIMQSLLLLSHALSQGNLRDTTFATM